jgi:alcohol dehydrogenase YqhD (iron-dependent ADH family)
MKWLWTNTTQLGFGENAVREHLPKFVAPNSKVLCTFGFGSIDRNGARADVQAALDQLNCTVRWEGRIPANPEYNRLVEIVQVVRTWKPDLLLAVGGGSILDGTKFIACAAGLPEGEDPWSIITSQKFTGTALPLASVITLPATGSEWNCVFCVSRRSIGAKVGCDLKCTFPKFSLIDPRYTMTLPAQQLRNGVYDAMTHCFEFALTPVVAPMMTEFFRVITKELVTIGTEVIKEGSSLELHERLIMAASFALNRIFALGGPLCGGIHAIGVPLTAKYGIDHGATMSMISIPFLESQFEARKENLAATAEFVFGIKDGTTEEKARGFLTELEKFIKSIGQPLKVSDWPGVVIQERDVEDLTKVVLTVNGGPVGYKQCATEDVIRQVLAKTVK